MRKYLEWRYDTFEATRARYPASTIPHHIWPDLMCGGRYAAINGPSDETWAPYMDLYEEPFHDEFLVIMWRTPELLQDIDYGA